MSTVIAWTDETWNPTTGCSKVSPGCANCYAERLSLRFGWSEKPWTPENAAENVVLHPERLEIPLRWRKPRMVFVDSMSDLFHENVPDAFIGEVFDVMARTRRHTFQVLTKRPERMAAWVNKVAAIPPGEYKLPGGYGWGAAVEPWPLPNVWLGVSVENQRMADERIPLLLETPAAVRFLSVEPLLEAVDLRLPPSFLRHRIDETQASGIDWVIVGGESGGPEHRRLVTRCSCVTYKSTANCSQCDGTGWWPLPIRREWVRSLRDQCVAADVPFFFKQFGGPKPTSGGRLLDGVTWDEMPQRQAAG